jgi:NADP-dependent 3-hydroxy acid dehydrogenase YdfG
MGKPLQGKVGLCDRGTALATRFPARTFTEDFMVSANSNGSIRGKAIVIAGGTTGIGRATACLLAGHGGRVLICGRKEEDLKEAMREAGSKGECHGLTADISQQADVERVFSEADEN